MSWIGGAFALVIVFLFGGYWCYVVIRRLGSDIKELRENSEPGTKSSIIVVWIITAFIAIVLLSIGFVLAVVSVRELRSWF